MSEYWTFVKNAHLYIKFQFLKPISRLKRGEKSIYILVRDSFYLFREVKIHFIYKKRTKIDLISTRTEYPSEGGIT